MQHLSQCTEALNLLHATQTQLRAAVAGDQPGDARRATYLRTAVDALVEAHVWAHFACVRAASRAANAATRQEVAPQV